MIMKLVCIFLLLIFSWPAIAQFDPGNRPDRNKLLYLKTNPMAMMQGPMFFASEFRLCAERPVRSGQSFQLSVAYLGKSAFLALSEAMMDDPYRFVVKGFRVTAEYRLYADAGKTDDNLLSGPYVAPYVSWASAEVSDQYSVNFNEYTKATYQHACIKIGYQFLRDRFVADFFTGAGYRNNVWTLHENHKLTVLDSKDSEPFPGHFKFLLGFNLGVSF